MANFQEVGQQWARMCKAFRLLPNGCSGCPLVDEHCYHESPFALDFDRIEYVVMQWAKENPESVYPTWVEWFRQMKIIPHEQKCFHTWLLEPIPADIAQKLCIEPKGE